MKRLLAALVFGLIASNPIQAQWVMAKVEIVVEKPGAKKPS